MTILNWSFPRKDITRQAQAFQLALAIREEVADLEKAGCKVIQVCFLLVGCVCFVFDMFCLACNGARAGFSFCYSIDMAPRTMFVFSVTADLSRPP